MACANARFNLARLPAGREIRVNKRDPQGYYDALNVSVDASPEEIVLSFRFLKEAFRERRAKLNIGLIQQAYEVLSDREKRRAYDANSLPVAASPERGRRGPSRFNSPVLLAGLLAVLVVVLALVKGPDLRASLVSFAQGDQLYLLENGSAFGTVVGYQTEHRFHNGARAPAYLLRQADGTETWYPARDLARISRIR